jgi:hypothetical protein
MTIRMLVLGLIIVAAACSKTIVGTETGNPPVISASSVEVEAIGADRVRVSGEPGAITPGGGEVAIANTSRDGDAVVTEVAEDGSFAAELEGGPNDDYEVVASNAGGRSSARTVSGSPPQPEPGDWQTLHLCDDGDPMDPLSVTELAIEGDTLNVSVSHGGGCEEHRYGLCYEDSWAESDPIQVGFRVLHDADGDSCDALLSKDLRFDLTPFERAYAESYRTDVGAATLGFSTCVVDDQPAGSCSVLYQWGDATATCGPPIAAGCPPFELPTAPATWVEYPTECGFSFRAPAGLVELDAQGTDSCVAQFDGAACSFHAGSGAFSGGLAEFEGANDSEVGQAAIHGHTAKLVTAVLNGGSHPYVAGAHFPEPPFPNADPFDVSADLLISCRTRGERDAVVAALGTVTFD